jgi:hypothetical protein
MSDYFAAPGVNWSTLKNLRDSALAYRYRLDVPIDTTPAMALGRLTHTLVFEPAKMDDEYAIWTDGDRRGKAWNEFKEANAGKLIFKPAEIDVALRIADAVRAHPLVKPYLVDGLFEHAISWVDPDTDLLCKGKPDWLQPSTKTLVDLKTTKSIEARRFGAQAARLGYHQQLAMYRGGVEIALGWKPAKVCIIAVESDAPYDVAVFEVEKDALDMAEVEVKELMLELQACRRADKWPGRYTTEQVLQLPGYIHGEVEFEYE